MPSSFKLTVPDGRSFRLDGFPDTATEDDARQYLIDNWGSISKMPVPDAAAEDTGAEGTTPSAVSSASSPVERPKMPWDIQPVSSDDPLAIGEVKPPEKVRPTEEPPAWMPDLLKSFFERFGAREQEELKTQLEVSQTASAVAGKAAVETAQLPVTVGKILLQLSDNQDIVENIESSEVGKIYSKIVDAITPNVTEDEEIAAEVLSYIGGGAGLVKLGVKGGEQLTKALAKKFGENRAIKIVEKIAPRLSGSAAGLVGVTALDLQFRDPDEQIIAELISNTPAIAEKLKEESPDALSTTLVSYADDLVQNVPGLLEAAEALKINPEDPVAVKTGKQVLDSLAGNAIFYAIGSLILKGGIPLVSKTGKSIYNKVNDFKEAKKVLGEEGIPSSPGITTESNLITQEPIVKKPRVILKEGQKPKITGVTADIGETQQSPIAAIPGATPSATTGGNIIPPSLLPPPAATTAQASGQPVIVNKFKENLAKWNTILGRYFSSNAALPQEIRDITTKELNSRRATLEIKKETVDLKRLQKKHNADPSDINDYLNDSSIPSVLPTEIKNKIDSIKTIIQNNEDELNSLLGLSGTNKLGVSLSNSGDVYITRTFEAISDPRYLSKIKKAVEGKLAGSTKPIDAAFVTKVDNAKNYLRNLIPIDPSETVAQYEARLGRVVLGIVDNVSKKESDLITNLFDPSINAKKLDQEIFKVLKSRKNIDQPILDLLGETSDPFKRIQTTLLNQHSAISRVNYLKELEDYFQRNLGTEIELPGLFPFLPSKKTTILSTEPITASESIIAEKNLDLIAKKTMGQLGGNSTQFLQNLVTDESMLKYTLGGIDPVAKMQNQFVNAFSKLSSFGQAAKTILDPGSYVLNALGSVQSLATNGHIFSPLAYKSAVTSTKNLVEQIRLKDPAALKLLDSLKQQGVIDSDVTGDLIVRNANIFGTDPKNLLSKTYIKSMEKLGTAYGQVDTWSKLVAHEVEQQALRKIYPYATQEEIFFLASERVKDTIPTYGKAPIAFKTLSKFPVLGNYVLFGEELMRTGKNIIKIGLSDIKQGLANGNTAQTIAGLKRLGGVAGTTAGFEAYRNYNNNALNITPDDDAALDILQPDWNKGSKSLFVEPLVKDDRNKAKKGDIYTRTISSSSIDMYDKLKQPVRLILAKLAAGQDIPNNSIDDLFKNISTSIGGSFFTPKFAAQTLLNVVTGVDEKNRPLYDTAVGATVKDKIISAAKDSYKHLGPNFVKDVVDYLEARTSEELLGEGNGQRASGFPMTTQDLEISMSTGIKPQTINLTKSIGATLNKDIKNIEDTDNLFTKKLRELPIQPVTEKLMNDIADDYRTLLDRQYEGMKEFVKKYNLFKKIKYKHIDESGKESTKLLDNSDIYRAVTSHGLYDANQDIFYAVKGTADKNSFIPLNPNFITQNHIKTLFANKKFTSEQITQLANKLKPVYQDYLNRPYIEKDKK